jgi:hypothetical protein
MRVQLLYFDGCPNATKALEDLNAVLDAEGLTVDVERIRVRNPSHARRLQFLGSPSIRVDGRDVEPEARSRTDYGFMCRTYHSSERVASTPSRKQILRAIRDSAWADGG